MQIIVRTEKQGRYIKVLEYREIAGRPLPSITRQIIRYIDIRLTPKKGEIKWKK